MRGARLHRAHPVLLVTDFDNLEILFAPGRIDGGDIALLLADQGAGNWRRDRNAARLDVRFVFANDLVGQLGTAGSDHQVDCRDEKDDAERNQ